jgi:hypothetical protein
MKSTFSIFVATVLLLASNSAEAARGAAAGNRNAAIPPTPQVSTAPPQTNPIGGTSTQSFGTPPGVLGSEFNPITGQSFGALPGQPGSPTFDPNAAQPSQGNAGSPSTSP